MSAAKMQRTVKNGNGINKRSVPDPASDVKPSPVGQELARLAPIDPKPSDAPMWPVHSVIWLQPELRPAVPLSSGLSIERQLRIPAPDFLNPGITAAAREVKLHAEPEPLPPELASPLPQSGLEPLGWDPREHFLKGGNR